MQFRFGSSSVVSPQVSHCSIPRCCFSTEMTLDFARMRYSEPEYDGRSCCRRACASNRLLLVFAFCEFILPSDCYFIREALIPSDLVLSDSYSSDSFTFRIQLCPPIRAILVLRRKSPWVRMFPFVICGGVLISRLDLLASSPHVSKHPQVQERQWIREKLRLSKCKVTDSPCDARSSTKIWSIPNSCIHTDKPRLACLLRAALTKDEFQGSDRGS
jgi:hypothetical protein